MDILLTLLAIAFFTAVLNIIMIQSNNFIFMLFRKPILWIVFMGLLSFFYFFFGSKFENSFNIVWLSTFFALLLNIPPKTKRQDAAKQMIDEAYREIGINNGRLKHRIGLFSYVVGGMLGWLFFYSQIVNIN